MLVSVKAAKKARAIIKNICVLPSTASGQGRCEINNGGCWHDTQNGITHSACVSDG